MTWQDCDIPAIRATAQAGDVMELRREREGEGEGEGEIDMHMVARHKRKAEDGYTQSECPDQGCRGQQNKSEMRYKQSYLLPPRR